MSDSKNRKAIDFWYSRDQKDYHWYSNAELNSILLNAASEDTRKLYEFYKNHPNSSVKHPLELGLNESDVYNYYDNFYYHLARYDSKKLKCLQFIPNKYCQKKFEDDFENNKYLKMAVTHPLEVLAVLITIIWMIIVFSIVGAQGFLAVFAIPEFILGLIVGYIILETVLVIVNNIILHQLKKIFINRQKSNQVYQLRKSQEQFLIDMN